MATRKARRKTAVAAKKSAPRKAGRVSRRSKPVVKLMPLVGRLMYGVSKQEDRVVLMHRASEERCEKRELSILLGRA